MQFSGAWIGEPLATLHPTPLTFIALVCAVLSIGILLFYLVRRPPLTAATKIGLLLGLGVFPIGVATAGNIEGFQATEKREFCGSCHVMVPHASDSENRTSSSLSSRHARNKLFGSVPSDRADMTQGANRQFEPLTRVGLVVRDEHFQRLR